MRILDMDLPSLVKLPLRLRGTLGPGPDVPDGFYCLDTASALDPCKSRVLLKRNALPAAPEEFEEAVSFMRTRVRDDRMMGHPVPRKQCTFSPLPYKNYQSFADPAVWPRLVHRVLEATRAFAAQLGIPDPNEYQGVHANFYPDGNSKVQKHADDELQLVPGAPIFSYTYVQNDDPSLAREFTIWRAPKGADHIEGKGKLVEVTLYSGDLLVMMGDMQRFFHHSIEPQERPVAPRLNLTVRKFVSRKDAMARARAASD